MEYCYTIKQWTEGSHTDCVRTFDSLLNYVAIN